MKEYHRSIRYHRCRRPFSLMPEGALILLLLAAAGQPLCATDRSDSLLFSWALVYQSDEGHPRPIDYDKNVVSLQSGVRFKIFLKPMNSCHMYLFLHDAQKNLYLLFPADFELLKQTTQIARNFELPGINSWFFLDENSGTEVFYLIVSKQRLKNLEERTLRYIHGRTDPESNVPSLTDKHEVLDEIRRIIKNSSYLSDTAEKPIAVAGDFRGVREEAELNGVRVEAADIYVKTIRIQH